MKSFYILLFFFLFTLTYAQQEPVSAHRQHWLEHNHLAKMPSEFNSDGSGIIPLGLQKVSTLSKVIFGYLPDWQYYKARDYLQYDLLTHIAAFDFHVSSNGSIGNPSYWPWTDVINAAHNAGVKVILTAVNFNAADIHNLLTDATAKSYFFSQLKSKLTTYKLDGVNIDFESLDPADRGSLLNSFMADLTDYIHTEFPGSEVSFAGPAVNWSGWDLPGLADACDYIFIMGYAFYGSWSTTSGPCAPLTGGSINNNNTVNVQYSGVTDVHPEKLVLGVPYYGNRWHTTTNLAYSEIVEKSTSVFYEPAVTQSETDGLKWDTQSQTAWFPYQVDSEWYQIWFDTDQSLALKYDLADSKNYLGIGMWALGYDLDRSELWDELRSRYVTSVNNTDKPKYPDTIILNQNYPNPFNPKTIIRYQLPDISEVELAIYNMLGQKVVTLVSGKQSKGIQRVAWDATGFSSGVYLYKIEAGGFHKVRKMILLR